MSADAIECRRRAVETGQEYLLTVIDRMNKNFEPVTEKEREEC